MNLFCDFLYVTSKRVNVVNKHTMHFVNYNLTLFSIIKSIPTPEDILAEIQAVTAVKCSRQKLRVPSRIITHIPNGL